MGLDKNVKLLFVLLHLISGCDFQVKRREGLSLRRPHHIISWCTKYSSKRVLKRGCSSHVPKPNPNPNYNQHSHSHTLFYSTAHRAEQFKLITWRKYWKYYFTFKLFINSTRAHLRKTSSRNVPHRGKKINLYYTRGCGHLSWFSWLRIPVSTLVERWKKLTTNCLWTRAPIHKGPVKGTGDVREREPTLPCQTCNAITHPSVSHRMTSAKCPIMVSFKL